MGTKLIAYGIHSRMNSAWIYLRNGRRQKCTTTPGEQPECEKYRLLKRENAFIRADHIYVENLHLADFHGRQEFRINISKTVTAKIHCDNLLHFCDKSGDKKR